MPLMFVAKQHIGFGGADGEQKEEEGEPHHFVCSRRNS